MTGTIARPSRPSVRFTALPAPTMMTVVTITKNQPKFRRKPLKNGTASEVDSGGRPIQTIARHAAPAMIASINKACSAREAGVRLLGDLQIVVVEADEAEAERHGKHDPDIWIAQVGPQQGRDHETGEDHQPAHGRRAALGDQMRLRTVLADRLPLALSQAQVVDDPRPEQEDEQRGRRHRTAGAGRDVTKHVQAGYRHAKDGRQVGQPEKHRIASNGHVVERTRRGKTPVQRLDDQFHFRTERALDHQGVTGAD